MTHTRRTALLLSASVGLMMTGFGVIMPVFARRLGELGGGVADLGLMTMSFALAHMVLSPAAGGLSDRIGRRPLILLGLVGFALSNVLYLLAPTTAWFIAARAVAGVLTAGLYPAAMGAVDDISAPKERASNVGLVMAGYGFGLVIGPVVGGISYEMMGFTAPFIVSGILGVVAAIAAGILVPETKTPGVAASETSCAASGVASRFAWLPRPLRLLGALLAIELSLTFAFAYVEPQMVFYVYDALGWSTAQFGIVASCYGVALALGQGFLSKASDTAGRRPVIVLGLVLALALYVGLATVETFAPMLAAAFVAGLGTGLVGPALAALALDITAAEHRGRVLGLKSAASSAGGVLGPLGIALVGGVVGPTTVFFSAACIVAAGLVLAVVALPRPNNAAATDHVRGQHHQTA